MICNKCGEAGVKNQCLWKEFYYCKHCKDEITLQEAKPEEVMLSEGAPSVGNFWYGGAVATMPVGMDPYDSHDWGPGNFMCNTCGITGQDFVGQSRPYCNKGTKP